MKTKFILPVITVALGVLLLMSLIVSPQQKIAYIDNLEIYNDFEMMKQLDQKFLAEKNSRKLVMDSLELKINVMIQKVEANEGSNNENDVAEINYLRQKYYTIKQQNEEEMKLMLDDYYSQVWTQLNQYISEYGKENGYSMIYGANADGTLMYADEALNITPEVKKFVNDKYNGL